MLELSEQNLKDINCEKHFFCADIMTDRFRETIKSQTQNFKMKIYTFLWWTFCNQNQTDMSESISNLMTYNDLLRFDCLVKPWDTQDDNIKIHEKYLSRLHDEDFIELMFHPLKSLGITRDQWKFELLSWEEEHVWSLLFRYYFRFEQDIEIEYDNKKFHFIKWEKVSLLDIRNYNYEKFIDFLKNFRFHLIDKNIFDWWHNVNRAQFLFKKSDYYETP